MTASLPNMPCSLPITGNTKVLGTILTDYCLRIAKNWGRTSVYAGTTENNTRMISLFVNMGFHIQQQDADGLLLIKKFT